MFPQSTTFTDGIGCAGCVAADRPRSERPGTLGGSKFYSLPAAVVLEAAIVSNAGTEADPDAASLTHHSAKRPIRSLSVFVDSNGQRRPRRYDFLGCFRVCDFLLSVHLFSGRTCVEFNRFPMGGGGGGGFWGGGVPYYLCP